MMTHHTMSESSNTELHPEREREIIIKWAFPKYLLILHYWNIFPNDIHGLKRIVILVLEG